MSGVAVDAFIELFCNLKTSTSMLYGRVLDALIYTSNDKRPPLIKFIYFTNYVPFSADFKIKKSPTLSILYSKPNKTKFRSRMSDTALSLDTKLAAAKGDSETFNYGLAIRNW